MGPAWVVKVYVHYDAELLFFLWIFNIKVYIYTFG